jgi:DNA-binding transcriptional ArsR family regulator
MFQNPLFGLRTPNMKVELDKKSLFALASDTRLEILKSLQPMRRTVSQLSESLNIDKAAVHRHLKKMEEGGLVTRYEDHGFVYYGLSWKARDLISPNENTRIIILLSATTFMLVLLGFFVAVGLTATDTAPIIPPKTLPSDSGAYENREIIELAHDSPGVWIFPTGVVVALIALFCYTVLQKVRRAKQKIDPKTEASDVPRPIPDD